MNSAQSAAIDKRLKELHNSLGEPQATAVVYLATIVLGVTAGETYSAVSATRGLFEMLCKAKGWDSDLLAEEAKSMTYISIDELIKHNKG